MEKQLVWCRKEPSGLYTVKKNTLYYYSSNDVNEFLYDIKTDKEVCWGGKGNLGDCIIKLLTMEEAIDILLKELDKELLHGYRSIDTPTGDLCNGCNTYSTAHFIKFNKCILQIIPFYSQILECDNGYKCHNYMEGLDLIILSDGSKLHEKSFTVNLFPEDVAELARTINFLCGGE